MGLRDRQIVVMGVMGAGKTTIGSALAERLGCPFYDADDFHPRPNVEKLAAGVPLTDDDRHPWIERIAAILRDAHERGETVVVACSALTAGIRRRLSDASEGVVFVHLDADPDATRERLRSRIGHFANPSLLDSQYAALEVPDGAIVAGASGTPAEIVERIVFALASFRE